MPGTFKFSSSRSFSETVEPFNGWFASIILYSGKNLPDNACCHPRNVASELEPFLLAILFAFIPTEVPFHFVLLNGSIRWLIPFYRLHFPKQCIPDFHPAEFIHIQINFKSISDLFRIDHVCKSMRGENCTIYYSNGSIQLIVSDWNKPKG